MDNRLELRHLRYFVAVAEELHFGRAAVRLGLSQPPLSQQIRQLERIVGFPLLERTSRAVRLTSPGMVFLDRARRVLARVGEDLDEARRVGRGEIGSLRVGFVNSSMLTDVPSVLGDYRARYPAVALQLSEAFSSQLIAGLLRHELDAAFLRDGDADDGLILQPLLSEPFIAIVPRAHRLAHRVRIPVGELRDDPFVMFPRQAGHRAHAKMSAVCESHGFRPRIVQEAPQWLTIVRLVGAELGVTLAPACVARLGGNDVRYLQLRGDTARSEIDIAYRRGDDRPVVRQLAVLAGRRLLAS